MFQSLYVVIDHGVSPDLNAYLLYTLLSGTKSDDGHVKVRAGLCKGCKYSTQSPQTYIFMLKILNGWN
jgi:hypothetical protein